MLSRHSVSCSTAALLLHGNCTDGTGSLKYDAFRSWRPNGICANLVHHPPATSSARSAAGCVVHGLGFLPTTSPTRDDETRRIDGSVHDWKRWLMMMLIDAAVEASSGHAQQTVDGK